MYLYFYYSIVIVGLPTGKFGFAHSIPLSGSTKNWTWCPVSHTSTARIRVVFKKLNQWFNFRYTRNMKNQGNTPLKELLFQ